MEVWELRQQDLDAREDDHVGGVGRLAVGAVPLAVEAVGTIDRPATPPCQAASRLRYTHPKIDRCNNH